MLTYTWTNYTALIAEDDPLNRRYMELLLDRQSDIKLLWAKDGHEASDLLNNHVDIVITSYSIHYTKLYEVTVGGDDTASTANRLAKFLAANNVKVSNIHVPKTIDNDLPLPAGSPTFGYNSAMEEGVKLATTIYEDARIV